ncbi:MAG TPA: DinB family protein [Anaerolineales bacterium]|nr:DinB family protein [Anaerolineales bacterium]
MDSHRAAWNKQQHQLQNALSDPVKHPEWISLFLSQHGQVHSAKVSMHESWSFEDEVLSGMDDVALRSVPPKFEHSVAWILWHLARCEDLTMNMLVAGTDQVLESQGWKEKLHSPILHTGNEIKSQEIIQFSQAVDLENLKAYRSAVGRSTRQVVSRLRPSDLSMKVKGERMDMVRALDAVLDPGILNYWSRRSMAGLLLMPPTRHCFTHLNEALRIKNNLPI